ncbi:MAG: hypothetical protein ABI891_05535, partial [Acidobacteriota bacterium]
MKNTNFIIACLLFVAFFVTANTTIYAQDEVMTNNEVISLAKAGLNSSIIVNKIRTSKSNFDLSTDSLIALKKAGVSDEIVTAMLEAKSGKTLLTNSTVSTTAANAEPNNPMSPHGFGIYLYEENNGEKKMTQLAPNVSAQNRTGGLFTSSMTYGIGKVKTKANLPGTTADLQIKESQPVFYFYLDNKSGGLNTSSGVPSTPNEFALVRFNIRSDNREVTIGKSNAFGAKGGLSDEYVVDYNAEDLGNGIFKVTPKTALKNGEYGFYLLNSGNSNAGAAVG